MTEHHTPEDPAVLDKTEARCAQPVKGMPWVLGVSTAAVVLIAIFTLVIFV